MKYFVFHSDGYADNGGVGLEEFDSIDAACDFISSRTKDDHTRTISDYTLIKGVEVPLKTETVITKVVPGE